MCIRDRTTAGKTDEVRAIRSSPDIGQSLEFRFRDALAYVRGTIDEDPHRQVSEEVIDIAKPEMLEHRCNVLIRMWCEVHELPPSDEWQACPAGREPLASDLHFDRSFRPVSYTHLRAHE